MRNGLDTLDSVFDEDGNDPDFDFDGAREGARLIMRGLIGNDESSNFLFFKTAYGKACFREDVVLGMLESPQNMKERGFHSIVVLDKNQVEIPIDFDDGKTVAGRSCIFVQDHIDEHFPPVKCDCCDCEKD